MDEVKCINIEKRLSHRAHWSIYGVQLYWNLIVFTFSCFKSSQLKPGSSRWNMFTTETLLAAGLWWLCRMEKYLQPLLNICCASLCSTEPVWMRWTCGSSLLSTRRHPRTEWRCVPCCWATAPTRPCSTVTARAPWTWPRPPSSKNDSPVSGNLLVHTQHTHNRLFFPNIRSIYRVRPLNTFLFPSLCFVDEFKGHSLLQAAREADMAKVKKTLALEIISFKHPQTSETALVRNKHWSLSLTVAGD